MGVLRPMKKACNRGLDDPAAELGAAVILAAFQDWVCTRKGNVCPRHVHIFQSCEECREDVEDFFSGNEAFQLWASLVVDDVDWLLSRLRAARETRMKEMGDGDDGLLELEPSATALAWANKH